MLQGISLTDAFNDAYAAPPPPGHLKAMDDRLYPTPPGQPLTAGEIALVKSIFGNEIQTGVIRKYFSAKAKKGSTENSIIRAQAFSSDYSLKFYGPEQASNDFSKKDNLTRFRTFVHEMTHIWQYQNPYWYDRRVIISYQYKLRRFSRFGGFSSEQQASIIGDYAQQFLFNGRTLNGKADTYLPSHAQDNKKSLRRLFRLARVVEKKFPEARKTRLALEAQRKQQQP